MTDQPQVHNPAGLDGFSVTSELWREYVWEDGFTYKVTLPERLYVKRKESGDSHRVVDADGVVHYVPVGWRILRWTNKPNQPEVEF
jgi:hypothetical protein